MINVLSIIHYPHFGGPHNRNILVAPLLARQGVKTTVLLPDFPGNAFERMRQAGLDVIKIPLHRMRKIKEPREHFSFFSEFVSDIQRIRKIIRERNIDIVQLNGLINPHGAIAAKMENAKVVWQITDTSTPISLRYIIMPLVMFMANAVMCTGMAVAREHPFTRRLENKMVYYYPPVDIELFAPDLTRRKNARKELELCETEIVVGMVGNLDPHKDPVNFLKAASVLSNRISRVKFVILGGQHKTPMHKKYVKKFFVQADSLGLKLGRDVIVRNPERKVADLAQAFDVLWMTSAPRTEGIPTVVEEAMSLCLPVVATNVGSVSEIVADGKTGFMVPPLDPEAIARATIPLIKNKGLRNLMGENARKFAVEKFSVQLCAKVHREAYEKALCGL